MRSQQPQKVIFVDSLYPGKSLVLPDIKPMCMYVIGHIERTEKINATLITIFNLAVNKGYWCSVTTREIRDYIIRRRGLKVSFDIIIEDLKVIFDQLFQEELLHSTSTYPDYWIPSIKMVTLLDLCKQDYVRIF